MFFLGNVSEYFFFWPSFFIHCSGKKCHFPKQTKCLPSRKIEIIVDQTPSKPWSRGKANSSGSTMLASIWDIPGHLRTSYSRLPCTYSVWSHSIHYQRIWFTLIPETVSERAFINCCCFLWFVCWSFADMPCKIEIRFNIPSIFSIEKQVHFSCVTASAINIFKNVTYGLQHFHDLGKHTALWR